MKLLRNKSNTADRYVPADFFVILKRSTTFLLKIPRNEWLKEERNISFEQIIIHLSRGDLWKVTDHPDQSNYPGQKQYFVVVDGYIYIVSYVVEKEYIFLKTIIPSRKAAKMYKEEQENQNEIR